MSTENKVDEAFGSSTVQKDQINNNSSKSVKPHLEPRDRLKVYIAISVLLEAGMSLGASVSTLLREYMRVKMPEERKIKAVEMFFGGIAKEPGMSSEAVVELANKAFGAAFMEPEECAVLSALGQCGPVATFKAAISIIEASLDA